MFLPKIAGADFYRLDEFFLFLLLHFCICLGHVVIAMCSAQICCVFWCWFNFFSWITTTNFLVLCFCQKLQEPILIGWASILLLLLHFCFCLGYAIILAGPALICCSFHCLINFFYRIPSAYLLLLCLRIIDRCCIFIIWASFWGLLVPVCFA